MCSSHFSGLWLTVWSDSSRYLNDHIKDVSINAWFGRHTAKEDGWKYSTWHLQDTATLRNYAYSVLLHWQHVWMTVRVTEKTSKDCCVSIQYVRSMESICICIHIDYANGRNACIRTYTLFMNVLCHISCLYPNVELIGLHSMQHTLLHSFRTRLVSDE